jgi:23S rRNA (pseudouridine1915-N3)-methyltransferase
MKIKLICAGKTSDSYIVEGIEKYAKRLKHYTSFELIEIPEVKGFNTKGKDVLKEEEAKLFLAKIDKNDYLILLDENGKHKTSVEFAGSIQNKMNRSISSIVFLVGGPFGFSQTMYDRADEKMSLSKMTFSHQMIRLFFIEQLYRSFSILRGEKYHHE